jgi:hypothetical protein
MTGASKLRLTLSVSRRSIRNRHDLIHPLADADSPIQK